MADQEPIVVPNTPIATPRVEVPVPSPPNPDPCQPVGPIEKLKDELRPVEMWTLGVACAGLVVATLTGVVFFWQFREMSKQTAILSGQAQQAASDSVEAAKRVERQLKNSEDQTTAFRGQLSEMKRSRPKPLIGIFGDVKLVSQMPTFAGARYSADLPPNMQWRINASIVNSGSASAVIGTPAFTMGTGLGMRNTWRDEKYCASSKEVLTRQSNAETKILYPSIPFDHEYPVGPLSGREDSGFGLAGPRYLVACIYYQDSDNKIHYTRALYRATIDDKQKSIPLPDLPEVKYIPITGFELIVAESDQH